MAVRVRGSKIAVLKTYLIGATLITALGASACGGRTPLDGASTNANTTAAPKPHVDAGVVMPSQWPSCQTMPIVMLVNRHTPQSPRYAFAKSLPDSGAITIGPSLTCHDLGAIEWGAMAVVSKARAYVLFSSDTSPLSGTQYLGLFDLESGACESTVKLSSAPSLATLALVPHDGVTTLYTYKRDPRLFGEVAPDSGTFTSLREIKVDDAPGSMSGSFDGSIWVRSGARVRKFEPSAGAELEAFALTDSGPTALAVGVWGDDLIATGGNNARGWSLYRRNASSFREVAVLPDESAHMSAVGAGPCSQTTR